MNIFTESNFFVSSIYSSILQIIFYYEIMGAKRNA